MAKTLQDLTDEELLQRCGKDDLRAYNELFQRHSKTLYKQAARYINDQSIAEELMMDLLFDVWAKRHERIIEGKVSAYLYRYMRNLIVDYRRRSIPVVASIDLLPEDELVDSRRADYHLISADMEMVYQDTLRELSPQRRRVFQLSREENLTYAEIAKEMDLSVNTVENYMVAALNIFRTRTKEISVSSFITFFGLATSCAFFQM